MNKFQQKLLLFISLVHQSRGDPDRDMWICTNHRKQKIRRTTGNNRKGRKILWCCDEENNPLTRTSQCPDRVRAAGYRRNVYPYRWCRHCERGIDENGENVLGRVIDRDLNAANNIGRVFTAYINSNGDPNSRPLYLRRPANQNQHIDAQMQEEELVREEIASEEEEILEGLHEGQGAQGGE
ncbi:hypothetical protein BDC45DRAFT_559213 [Circinella umbellata]|nr:hypothetical protein BDC45DRAFT_559213 [Circinella umbellata]